MRLLHVDTLEFQDFFNDDARPEYAIASHRWVGTEATYQDLKESRNKGTTGYRKVEAFARYVREHASPIKWLWIDTCCIDKTSAAELSEAINLMFDWYENAAVCFAYLVDVKSAIDRAQFVSSEWFRRGWTLQELLAPSTVVFFTEDWQVIGHKGRAEVSCDTVTGPSLNGSIATITGISQNVLQDYAASHDISIDDKLQWMHGRVTTRPEDMTYALYGIVGVTLGANYGEKREGARQRFLTAIGQRNDQAQRANKAAQDAERFRKIKEWLSPPDPWSNHESARQIHEPNTGTWLLRSPEYQSWKRGSTRCLWLYGKAGCGKTVLCSTAIEDIRSHRMELSQNDGLRAGHAIFYFSFSDQRKQTHRNLQISLVAQLGWKEPALSKLQDAFDRPNGRLPDQREMQTILQACLSSYDVVFLHLDALDECPDSSREQVFSQMHELLRHAENIRVVATSRDLPDIRQFMGKIDAQSIAIAEQMVKSDIQQHVKTQISRNRKLSRLDAATRILISDTLSQKADGMFRWVHCQLQELTRSKSTQPKAVKEALLALPETLDETYQRVLEDLDTNDHQHALTLLRWLAYAATPRSLEELAEACIIDPTDDPGADGVVDRDNRGAWEDTLEMLAGLVITIDSNAAWNRRVPEVLLDIEPQSRLGPQIEKTTKIRLAHFSVKEYLESSRILSTDVRMFHLDPAREHRFLTQSCLVYLTSYSRAVATGNFPIDHVFEDFPLLRYCADYWPYHASRQSEGHHSIREIRFLSSDLAKRHWLAAKDLNNSLKYYLEASDEDVGPALNHASYLGLVNVARDLLDKGVDVNSMGGPHGPPLSEAARRDHPELVRMLIDAGADVNIQDGKNGTVLQVAAHFDSVKVVPLLIASGADLDDSLGSYGTAIQAAAFWGNVAVVETLIRAGANVNAHNRVLTSPLTAAAGFGNVRLARILIDAGADLDIESHMGITALQETCFNGPKEILRMLLDAGANPNVETRTHGTALHVACQRGRSDFVRMLLDAGADIDLPDSKYMETALTIACGKGDAEIVDMLIRAGADVNAQGHPLYTALSAACARGHEGIVQMLIQAGADVHLRLHPYARTALEEACAEGHENIVRRLIDAGAEVNDFETGFGSHSLLKACSNGHESIVQMLIAAGAQVDVEGSPRGRTIQAAWSSGHMDLIPMLIVAAADQKVARTLRKRREVGVHNEKVWVMDETASSIYTFDDYEEGAVSDDDSSSEYELPFAGRVNMKRKKSW